MTPKTYRAYAIVVTIKNRGARPTRKRNNMSKGKQIILDDKALIWIDKHYKHTLNRDCATHLGISPRSVCRIAAARGLTKSRQFMTKCQKKGADAAKASHLRNGTYPPKGTVIPRREEYYFRERESLERRLGKKRAKEARAKAAEGRRKTWKSEKARATFGFPQRTKLRVIPQPRAKVQLRYYLKTRGYIVDDVKRIVYYDENTRRGKRIETKPQRWYKFEQLTQKQL